MPDDSLLKPENDGLKKIWEYLSQTGVVSPKKGKKIDYQVIKFDTTKGVVSTIFLKLGNEYLHFIHECPRPCQPPPICRAFNLKTDYHLCINPQPPPSENYEISLTIGNRFLIFRKGEETLQVSDIFGVVNKIEIGEENIKLVLKPGYTFLSSGCNVIQKKFHSLKELLKNPYPTAVSMGVNDIIRKAIF